MIVRDGDGTMIDFEWPSLWYLVKAGMAVTVGVCVASVLMFVVMLPLYLAFVATAFRAVMR